MHKTIETCKQDFPIFNETIYGKSLVYLDNAATTQKPRIVIERLKRFYEQDCSNVHRGAHALSERATVAYENARKIVQQFIHAPSTQEIIFTKGTTDAINLVAQSYGRTLQAGDEIIISAMEHHANIVPWQLLAEQIGLTLRVIPINEQGELDITAYREWLNEKTKLVSIVHVSNVLGTINPVETLIELAHANNTPVLLDGAQAVPHLPVNVQTLDCDFYTFSGHKVFGPTGIGILYGKSALLDSMPPYQGGGQMIRTVSFEKTTYNTLPYKFEAGTPAIAQAIGLGTALNYLMQFDLPTIAAYEQQLLHEATEKLTQIPGLRIIGHAKEKAAVISYVLDTIHAHDIATILDREGIAVRSGHHCCMPLMKYFNIPATTRASFAFYNNPQDIDRLVESLKQVKEIFTC